MSAELPEWVVERCDSAKMKAFVWDGARHEQLTAAALDAFLAIIAERAGPDWAISWEGAPTILNGYSYPDYRRATLAELLGGEPPECQHEWIDARNKVVNSGEICRLCNSVRRGNSDV